MKNLLALAFCATASFALAGDLVYGVKTTGSATTADVGPTRLFSFDSVSGVVSDIAWVTFGGNPVLADGLAYGEHTLYGFLLDPVGSRLVSIDPATGVASSLAFYQGTAMRGATYKDGKIVALDVIEGVHWNAATIDLSTFGLSLATLDTTVANGCDLAYDSAETLWVAESNAFHVLNPTTGALTFVAADNVRQGDNSFVYNVGFEFDAARNLGSAMTFEANGTDDLNLYPLLPATNRTALNTHILNSFNAGRGDLATVPEPATLGVLGLGLAALAAKRRRRA